MNSVLVVSCLLLIVANQQFNRKGNKLNNTKGGWQMPAAFVLLSLGFVGNSRGRLLPFDKRLFAANIEITKPF